MASEDFKNMHVKNTVFQYINLAAPRAFDMAENTSKTVEPTHPQGKWSISWILSAEEADQFQAECKDHFEARRKENPKISEFGAIHGFKERDDGTVMVTASRKSMSQSGKQNKPVNVIDEFGKPITDLDAVWGGSKGTATFSIYPAPNPSSGKWGISIGIGKVQILERSEGGGDDGGVFDIQPAPATDVFGLPATDAPQAIEDEIPF